MNRLIKTMARSLLATSVGLLPIAAVAAPDQKAIDTTGK